MAQSVQAGGVRFYESGIVSLNLPIAEEALRARASRTTHPVALHLFASLCAAVTERDFAVDNPYLFKTKAEVVATLATHQAADLIADTCSCSHSMFQSKTQRHCGRCSQCIDRRFATTAADLLAYDSKTDYVSDVFVGPRKDALQRAIAVDYTRHGMELYRRSESELAAIFNAELSRAVRYESKRGEAAQRIISMHKRHGEVVTRVLEQKVAENAPNLVAGNLDGTSLLALAIGQEHLRQHYQVSTEAREHGSAESGSAAESPSSAQLQGAALERVEETLRTILAKLGGSVPEGIKAKKKRTLGKRDIVIFAAILLKLKGMKYCSFLQDHGIKPKWAESGPPSYPRGYQAGDPWRKKVQDEKTRAKARMDRFANSELADAFNAYLPESFDLLAPMLHSRDSQGASKTRTAANQHKTYIV